MKKTMTLFLLPLLPALLPAAGWAQSPPACDSYAKAVQSVDEQIKPLNEQWNEEFNRSANEDRGKYNPERQNRMKALKEQMNALQGKRSDLWRQFDECAKRETQKHETEMKARTSDHEKAYNSKMK
jgi:Skp family chaperone for outer membrane proteins